MTHRPWIVRTVLAVLLLLYAVSVTGALGFDLFGWLGRDPQSLWRGKAAAAPASVPVTAATPGWPPGVTPNYRAIVRDAGPAVVGITVTGAHPALSGERPPGLEDDPFFQFFRGLPGFQGRTPGGETPFRSQGSGFIISQDGLVLTNAHVVRDAKELTVKLGDGREFRARVLGTDTVTDVAVLRIPASKLPVVRLGDAQQLQVGDPVLAIGSPFGFEQSATQGIVSAKGRSLPGETAVPYIQTDVAVNPGNSGGPLFDATGAVVGINAQIYSRSGGYQGLSFAIPINVALKVKDQILATGRATHARLGVVVQDLDQALAESFGLDRPAGALLVRVASGSAAADAGLRPGDVVTHVNGEAIQRAGDLSSRIGMASPGDTVRLTVWRNRAVRDLNARLGRAKDDPVSAAPLPERAGASAGPLGLRMRELTGDERIRTHVDAGLLVEAVSGAAANAGLRPGDIVLAVNGVAVRTVAQMHALLDSKPPQVALLVDRNGDRLYVAVRTD